MRSTSFTLLSLFLLLSSVTGTDASKVPFRRRSGKGVSVKSLSKSSVSFGQSTGSSSLNSVNDIRYITNITINGIEVPVALDTGSTDLWVAPPGGIGRFNDSGIEVDLFYGDGTTTMSGTIGVSPFEFGPYEIKQQAFLNVVRSTKAGLQELGIFGLIGLSFDFVTASPIEEKIQSLYGPYTSWGQSVLKNIFQQNPAEPNYIALELSRTGDLEDTDGGSFTIGETLSKYASVRNQRKLAQYPRGGDRWTTLLEGVYVDRRAVEVVSTIPGVAVGRSQTLLDTGNPFGDFPTAMFDAIYSSIPGSVPYDGGSNGHQWVIPCNTTTNIELVFGGQRYPIHPLDLSTISDPFTVNGQSYVSCLSAFVATDGTGHEGFDVALGDSFLRNVYSVFDFGATASDGSPLGPFIQLLSKTDPSTAAIEVATIRGKTLANLPPELDPHTYVATSAGPSADGSTSASSSGDFSTDEDSTKSKSESDVDLALGDNVQTVTVDSSMLKKYGLIAIALLGANLLVGLVLILLGVLAFVRRGSLKSGATRVGAPVYVPVKNVDRDEGYSDAYLKPYSQ